LGWAGIHNEVNSRPQEVRTVRRDHERIDGFQCVIRQLNVVSNHDDGNLWSDLLDLGRNDRAVQKTQFVVKHNRIHWARHEKP
jgi:hypothetical protein